MSANGSTRSTLAPNGATEFYSLLQKLEDESIKIDMDSIDPDIANGMPFKPHNQTSNQVIIYDAMIDPRNKELFVATCKEFQNEGWEEIFNRVVGSTTVCLPPNNKSARLCRENIANITERVLLQTSARYAYDKDKVIEHARTYDRLLAAEGIGRDRYCIKVPCTGPAMAAARVLNDEGIRTLGTSLFSLPQALAASQSGCLMISPYFNECNAPLQNFALWPNVVDPARDHPFSYRVRHILDAYTELYRQTGTEQPKVMAASFVTPQEVVGLAEQGIYAVTLPPILLKSMAVLPAQRSDKTRPSHPYAKASVPERFKDMCHKDPLAGPGWDGKLATLQVNYIADNGAALDAAIKADAVTGPRLQDALDIFAAYDLKAKAAIETVLASF